jgi:hypothetical protein
MENIAEERLQALTWTITEMESLIRCQDDTMGRLQGLFDLWELRTERLRILKVLHAGR